MNKNTKEIANLKESIAEFESVLANLKRNKLAAQMELCDKKNEKFEINENLLYIEKYIECYNDFKKIVHKPDAFNFFLLFFFLLNISLPIISGTGVFTPITTILLYTTGLFNIADIFLRHKLEFVDIDSIKEMNPLNFNNKYFKKELEREKQLTEAKEKLLKEIDELIEVCAVCQSLIIRTEEEMQSDKDKLHELIQEQETRNRIIKTNFFKEVSKLLNSVPEFQSDFIKKMNEDGFNLESVSSEDLLFKEDLALKLRNKRGSNE